MKNNIRITKPKALRSKAIILLIFLVLNTIIAENTLANDLKPFNQRLDSYNHQLKVFNQKKQIKGTFLVAVANNHKKRSLGLMFIENLAEDHGMLFTFDQPQIVTMWMKNTFINLDMIFIDNNNQIVKIAHNRSKNSLNIISSDFDVDKVLEINGQIAKKLNIKIGDFIKVTKNENLQN